MRTTTLLRNPALRLLAVLALVAGLMATSATQAFAGDDFDDVPDDHTFHDEIAWMVDEGITTGYDDNTYRPTWPVSRQAKAAFLFRFAGSPEGDWESDFDDVPEDHRFYEEISWAAEEGITEGYADGNFRPTSAVSRQASAAFLYRFGGEPLGDYSNDFDDVDENHRFHDEISWLAENDVTRGYEDNTFRPVWAVSRQAAAAFLFRFDNLGQFVGVVMDVSDAQAGEIEDGEPLEGAAVHVTDDGDIHRIARTDADGLYHVFVPEGTYDLEATADGYAEAYGHRVENVGVTAGGVTGVDFGLYPTATEPTEYDETGSDDSHVDEREDWWVIEVVDTAGVPLAVSDQTEIVYVNPDGVALSLGNAGTGANSWWEKPTEHAAYADGDHRLYYNLGTPNESDWRMLEVTFLDGQLVAVNGSPYSESLGAASEDGNSSGGDEQPDEGVVVPNS